MSTSTLAKYPTALVVSALLFTALAGITIKDATSSLWREDEHGYIPFLLVLNLWLFARQAKALEFAPPTKTSWLAVFLLIAGCIGHVLGRSQQIMLLELACCYVLLVVMLLLAGGKDLTRKLAFPILFLLFTIPWPSWMVDYLTIPLKIAISQASSDLLYAMGYPVAQSGVVLALGPYRLLVMDACSGLHSLINLTALGVAYIHLTGRRRTLHLAFLLTALLPIAILANFVRVFVLLLVTYHLGDAVGQSYWHAVAGLVLFGIALAALYLLDSILFGVIGLRHALSEDQAAPKFPQETLRGRAQIGLPSQYLMSASLLLALLLPYALSPEPRVDEQSGSLPALEYMIPERFADWQHDAIADQRLITPALLATAKDDEHRMLARTYVNGQGERIMLLISSGSDQNSPSFEEHRPEYCYKAQGFTLIQSNTSHVSLEVGQLPVKQLIAQLGARFEPITYWMTIGQDPTLPGIERRWHKLRYALQGLRPDGMLIRISSVDPNSSAAFAMHSRFLFDLQQAVPHALGFAALDTAGVNFPL